MKYGIIPLNVGLAPDQMIKVAQHAEAVGIESVWTFEHVMMPVEYQSKYPYSPDGRMGAPPETPIIDPLIALSTIAAATSKIRLGTGVNILPQVNPLLIAKQAASLDVVSGGRFMLGVGIGWLKEEFDAMGTPFEKRGARFDDYVAAMKKVWAGDVVEHDSEYVSWSGFKSYPLPVQNPFPVHIGGSKGKIMQRIAQFGDGWFAPEGDPDSLKVRLRELEQECQKIGRDSSTIEISIGGGMNLDYLKRLRDVGVHRVIFPTAALGADVFKGLDAVAELSEKI